MFIQTLQSSQPAGRIGDFEFFWAALLLAHAWFDRPEYWMSAICISELWNTAFCPMSVCRTQKIRPDLFSRPNLLWSRAKNKEPIYGS